MSFASAFETFDRIRITIRRIDRFAQTGFETV